MEEQLPIPAAHEKISEQDRFILEMAKNKKTVAQLNAEKAISQNETAELTLRNVILQLALRYNLKDDDTISEDGSIVRKGK